MKRISRKVREEAILALEVAANHWPRDAGWQWRASGAYEIAEQGGLADLLCDEIVCAVCDVTGSLGCEPEVWLEAAALLRDGWNPGDPVVKL